MTLARQWSASSQGPGVVQNVQLASRGGGAIKFKPNKYARYALREAVPGVGSTVYSRQAGWPAPSDSSPTTSQIRNLCDVTFLWRGSPIQANKFYGTPRCTLCMRERIF